jgi:ankyrin repeat protein
VNVKAPDGDTILMNAVRHCNNDVIALLLAKGADVDALDAEGETALMHAINNGDLEVATLLLDKGANVDIKNAAGDTALTMAKEYERQEIQELLEKRIEAQRSRLAEEKRRKEEAEAKVISEARMTRLKSQGPVKPILKKNEPPKP